MSKLRNNEKGFGVVEGLLIVAVVVLLGVVGYMVYKNHHKTTTVSATKTTTSSTKPATSSTSKSTAPSTTTTPQTATLKIPELGIQIVNIPSSISDLNYAITGKDSTGGSIAEISTVSLSKLDPSCSPTGHVSADGTLASYEGTYDSSSAPLDNTAFVKQFNGFWIAYSHPESQCSNTASTEALHVSQTATFQTLATNPANIEAMQ